MTPKTLDGLFKELYFDVMLEQITTSTWLLEKLQDPDPSCVIAPNPPTPDPWAKVWQW